MMPIKEMNLLKVIAEISTLQQLHIEVEDIDPVEEICQMTQLRVLSLRILSFRRSAHKSEKISLT